MTTPRSPEGEMVDIMQLDREIEALRGGGRSADDGLSVLLQLRDDVDRRAARLLGEHDFPLEMGPRDPAAGTRRRRRHHRLAVIPAAGALVLASAGVAAALSGSPHAPLYPLHRLIFGAAPSSDGQVARDLAEAEVLLNRAAAEPYAARAGALAQARLVLAQARNLLPLATSRTRFSLELSAALARLTVLETPPISGGTLPLPTPLASPLPMPTAESEGATLPQPAGSETESPGLAPAGGQSEAPESVAAVNPPVSEAPEAVNSAAPHRSYRASDNPTESQSGSSESGAQDN